MMDGKLPPYFDPMSLVALGGGIMGGRLGRGLQGFAQVAMQGQQMQRQAKLDTMREQALEGDLAAKQQQGALLDQLTAGMPQQQAALLRLGGPEALQAEYARLYGPQKAPTTKTFYSGGNQYEAAWDEAAGSWKPIPGTEAPRWQPQTATPRDSYALLGDDEVKALGFAPGTKLERNARSGNLEVVQSPPATTDAYVDLTPEEVKALGFTEGTVVQRNTRNNDLQVAQAPRGPGITMTTDENGNPVVTVGGAPASQSIQKDVRARQYDFTTMRDVLGKYRDMVTKEGLTIMPGKAKGEMVAQYGLVLNELRKLTESGALQKADLEFLQSLLLDPTSVFTAAGNVASLGGATSQLLGGLDTFQRYIGDRETQLAEQYPDVPMVRQPGGAQDGPAATPPAPPTVGEVRSGYKFKGGDPADPASWERVNG